MGRGWLALFGFVVACRSGASSDPRPMETVVIPPPVALDEPPVEYPTFDAGGRDAVEIPTVRCDDESPFGTTRVFPPPTWSVKVTKELLSLDDPASQLRLYVSPFQALLGPPGFGCRSVMHTSGYSLAILPVDRIGSSPVDDRPLDDELVRIEGFSAHTSGFWTATTLASRVFPNALHARRQEVHVARPWLDPGRFPTNPYPGERVVVDGLHASYVDPPGISGIAAEEWLVKPNADPILGTVVADPDGSIVVLAVRLRAEREPLIAAIIAASDAREQNDAESSRVRALPRCTEGAGMDGTPCAGRP